MKHLAKKSLALLTLSLSFFIFPQAAHAQFGAIGDAIDGILGGGSSEGIKNPVIGDLGNDPAAAQSGSLFLRYFVTLWRALITVGAILVLVYFLWGAIEWIVAGGDQGKVQKARDRMTQAAIGLVLLVGSFTILAFLSMVFFGDNFNILELTIPDPLDTP